MGKDRPHTSGKSVLGVTCLPEVDTFLFASKTSQHLGHTEGICSCELLGFISQQSFSICLGERGVCLQLPSLIMQFVFQGPLTIALNTKEALPSPASISPLCLLSTNMFCNMSVPQGTSKVWMTTNLDSKYFNQLFVVSFLMIWNCCSHYLFFSKQPY